MILPPRERVNCRRCLDYSRSILHADFTPPVSRRQRLRPCGPDTRGASIRSTPSGKPELKLSLAGYSFRQALDLKKPSMTLFDFIDFASELPLDAVELTSYYWAETTDAYAEKLRARRRRNSRSRVCRSPTTTASGTRRSERARSRR